jgi:ABC-type spermidine/putrescine transport system permease subunit II
LIGATADLVTVFLIAPLLTCIANSLKIEQHIAAWQRLLGKSDYRLRNS